MMYKAFPLNIDIAHMEFTDRDPDGFPRQIIGMPKIPEGIIWTAFQNSLLEILKRKAVVVNGVATHTPENLMAFWYSFTNPSQEELERFERRLTEKHRLVDAVGSVAIRIKDS